MSDPFGRRPKPERSLAMPMLLGLAALLLSFMYQTYQLVGERSNIAAATADQAPAVQEGDRLRNQVEGLLGGINTLANNGNASAASVVADLAKQGINYKPQPTPPAPGP